jgi:hypothetical protein
MHMNRHSHLARLRRAARLALIAGLALNVPRGAAAQGSPAAQSPPGAPRPPSARETRWVADHISLDLLPVAYVLPRGRFSLGGSMNMPPVGFPTSHYSLYPDLQYGVAGRTQAAVGVSGADRLGTGGEAIFYTLGLQHVLLPETRTVPTLSLGGYGFLAPHNRHGGVVYLVASKQLTRRAYPRGVFAHLGLEVQTFANADSDTGAQPFVGANYVWSRHLRFSAEYRPRMSWEREDLYSFKGVVLLYRGFGVTGGYRDNGYRAHPFIGIEID